MDYCSRDEEWQAIMDAQKEGWGDPLTPAVEKVKAAEWTLDKDGLAMKAFAAQNVGGTAYGLIIARRNEDGRFMDPKNLTRGQMETIRDFVGFVLEDSEG